MRQARETVARYIRALMDSDQFGPQVVSHRILDPRPADSVDLPGFLDQRLRAVLAETGITSLYRHQHEAITRIREGKDVLVATPTASGKSLIYNLPVFQNLLDNPRARALYLFPLKALAQDQLSTIRAYGKGLESVDSDCPGAIYDGDTPESQRRKIRARPPAILLTNPDMLHLSLLAHHYLWGHLLSHLSHVIIDEVHTYRGVFGSHMAWVLRRLNRICALYGSRPVHILSSATIGNPGELGQALLDRPLSLIEQTGAPSGRRHVILLNPADNPPYSAALLLVAAVHRGLRTIVYTSSRRMTELITIWAARRLGKNRDRVASYRAGFLAEDRRRIEQAMARGDLLGVISTSALELGIDIGGLDICILAGYPGSMMATWQRAGRVGRGGGESLLVMIGGEDALDQHFMRHPDEFFNRPMEPVVLDPDNPVIASAHLCCAAAEKPLEKDDPLVRDRRTLIDTMTDRGRLHRSADGRTWFSPRKAPHHRVSLRGSGRRFLLRRRDSRAVIGEVDGHRVFRECHPGAIYLHMARQWLVRELDLEAGQILVEPVQVAWNTRPLVDKDTEILNQDRQRVCGSLVIGSGRLRVTESVRGYQRILIGRQKVIATQQLDLPDQVFETRGIWLVIPDTLRQRLEREQYHFMGAIHGLEHAIIGCMPLAILCDRGDIGGISFPFNPQLDAPAVFIYDGHEGGIGLCDRAYSRIRDLLTTTMEIIDGCGCERGCPSCVHSPKCGSGNRPMDKQGCRLLLRELVTGKTGPTVSRNPVAAGARQTERRVRTDPPRGYGVFDLETRRSAAEVGGWHRAEQMGISVAVIFDGREDRFFTYREEQAPQLLDHLFSLELVVGFNNKRFDNRVLSPYSERPLSQLPSLDILELVYRQLGYRLSLDRLAEQTLGVKKSGDGLQALRWFNNGEMEKLADYCRQDVQITRDLFLFGLRQQHLLFCNKAGETVRLPVDFGREIDRIQARGKTPPVQGQTSFR